MLDFITIPLTFGVVTMGIYGLFELYARRKERLLMIEKMVNGSNFTLPNYNFLGSFANKGKYTALKAGLLLSGLGLGLFIATMIILEKNIDNYGLEKMIYGSSALMCGGAGLLISFIIEHFLSKEKHDKKE